MKTVILAVALSTLALASWGAPSGPPKYRVEVVGGSDPVARMTYGLAMNNLGQVTGYSRFDDPDQFRYGSVFLYGNHALRQIAPLNEGTSRGLGINDRGDIVGSFGRDGSSVPYLYRDGRVIELDGLAPGWGGEARAINQAGQVVGTAGNGRSFIYDNGRLRYLSDEPLRSYTANAINDHGVVAGEIFTSCCTFEGFVYSDGQTYDLNDLLWGNAGELRHITDAVAINDAGQLLVHSRNNTPWRSFRTLILTPIPEPSTWAMLLAGVGVVGVAAPRRRG